MDDLFTCHVVGSRKIAPNRIGGIGGKPFPNNNMILCDPLAFGLVMQ